MQNKLPKREEVPSELTWRLEDIYDDETKWETELVKSSDIADKMAALRGRLSESGEVLLELLAVATIEPL